VLADKGYFGKVCVGSFADEPLTLNNSGHCPLTVTAITSSSPEFVAPEVLAYPLVVAPGDSLAVPIRFAPTSFGAKSATITVKSNAPGKHTVKVEGQAPSGKIAVTGSLCIGAVPACCRAERTISICNVGDCALHVKSVAFEPPNKHWKLVNNPFPAKLAPGSCLGLVVRYKATEKYAILTKLVITSDDPATPVKKLDAMAYTDWCPCGCKECGGNCEKCGCEQCRRRCCPEGAADDCCTDEDDEREGHR
jgi:hypothetical protein